MVNRTRRLQRRKTRRTYRVRNGIRRCSTRGYRLSVFRSNKNIYAQLINDKDGVTICAANSLQKSVVEGNGPCNEQRLNHHIKAHKNGAWVREAAKAYSQKHNN